uniref:Zasp-like motif domain-containing protein n=1 Tax=Acrobeloides nanus TaxID=290746 RepID=A0A914CDR7_9BILA
MPAFFDGLSDRTVNSRHYSYSHSTSVYSGGPNHPIEPQNKQPHKRLPPRKRSCPSVLIEGVAVPQKLLGAFLNKAQQKPFSYTEPLPPSIFKPEKPRLNIPKVCPIVPPELLEEEDRKMLQHLQYNSPMQLYSREAAEEQYIQQAQQVPNPVSTSPIPLGGSNKHFDPSKSATLKAIQELEKGDTFGQNFFEKIAEAEAPKVPPTKEPAWAREARQKSERARSLTPGPVSQRPYSPPLQNGAIPLPPPPQQTTRTAIPLGLPQTYTTPEPPSQQRSYSSMGQSYYEPRLNVETTTRRRTESEKRHHSPVAGASPRGYEFGGLDYIDHSRDPDRYGNYQYYETNHQSRRDDKRRSPQRPGYNFGLDFNASPERGKGVYYDGRYHGYGPEKPRSSPKFSADPHAPINTYTAHNVESVNPIRLVGDTLSNMRIQPEKYLTDEEKRTFAAVYAPAPGFKKDHITVRPPPKQPEPICYSLSAKDMARKKAQEGYTSTPAGYNTTGGGSYNYSSSTGGGGYNYNTYPRSQSAVPFSREQQQYQGDNWYTTGNKEVTIDTLLTDEALKPIRRSVTPDWTRLSERKHENWQRTTDPRNLRPQVLRTEPNWTRTVNQRKGAWEARSRNVDSHVQQPAWAKVPPQQPPYWSGKSNAVHNVWQEAADRNLVKSGNTGYNISNGYSGGQQQQQYNYSSSYSTQQQTPGYNISREGHRENFPVQKTTSYSYSSGPGQVYQGPGQVQQESSWTSRREERTSNQQQTQPIPLPAPQQESYSQFSQQRREERREETKPIALPPPQQESYSQNQWSQQRREERREETKTIPLPSPQQTYNQWQEQRREERRTTTEESRPIPLPPQENYSQWREEKRTYKKTTEQISPIPLPPPQQTQSYQESRNYQKKTEERQEVVPVQQPSPTYLGHRDYNRFYKKETTERRGPHVTGGASQTVNVSTQQPEQFDRVKEMAETIPHGSIANTFADARGEYKDREGKNVSYKRELTTSVDPGKEYQLLKEEERRVTEEPIEPGVISRHVTTKYYKKKTVTDTTTTAS